MIPGDVATLTYALAIAGTPTDATVTLTVTSPAGVVSTPPVDHPGTGSYSAEVLVTEPGRWTYLWAASGLATDAETGAFRVDVVGLETSTLKKRLNIGATFSADDAELADTLAAAIEVVEGEVGPIVPRVVVETVTASWAGTALLRLFPVGSVVTDGLTVDSAGTVSGLPYGASTVTYVAGRPPTAAQAEAVYLVAADLWESQHSASQTDPDTGQYVLTPLLHRRVRELLTPTRLGPRFA